ncbi:MAG TPA: hypothetical protein VFN41_01770, partial [Candidatus Limnocylindrales bacterium]|nr:hypothetical protein [Candidatus Limnocylindrales bacterium]
MSALLRRQRAAILLMSVALIVAACGEAPAVVDPAGAPAPTPTPIVQPSVVPSADPSASPADPADGHAASPTPRPSEVVTADKPSVRPAPPIPTVWSKAAVVMSGECFSPTATVDSNGTFHIVSGCGMGIRYATSKDGKRWRTTTLPHLAHRSDVEPQIAVDGSTLYVAYTRQRQLDGGCGYSGLVDVGVYYRTRTL